MFFTGDIQSGIARAQAEAKGVVCFVRDDGEDSLRWANDYLKEEETAAALDTKAIALRIEAGSQEAQLLSAVTPGKSLEAPTLVVIHNGQLRAYLTGSASREKVKEDLLQALDDSSSSPPAPTSHDTSMAPRDSQSSASIPTNSRQPTSSPRPLSEQSPPSPAASPEVTSLLSDRRQRMEEREAVERADRQANARARRLEAEAAESSKPVDPKRANEIKYAQQQRKRQQDARAERDRILRLVEHDRIERREKEERRKALARAEAEKTAGSDKAAGSESPPPTPGQSTTQTVSPSKSTSTAAQCAIQIRLFDGSTIRSRFPSSTATIDADIRPWIDGEVSPAVPYTFKHILPPPSSARPVSLSEESNSLGELGLAPSATLVLTPVPGRASSAYEAAAPGLLGTGIGLVTSGIGTVAVAVGGAVAGLIGLGARNVGEVERERVEIAHMGGGRGVRVGGDEEGGSDAETTSIPAGNVRTLRDRGAGSGRDDDNREFYNGNQLNFAPNRPGSHNEDRDEKKD